MEKLINKIEELGWTIENCDFDCYELGKPSSFGQDFHFVVDSEGDEFAFIDNVYNAYVSFDVSYEAYLWLDEEGHGKNGAPWDMRDVYNDMEECQESIHDLYVELKDWYDEFLLMEMEG